jgi:CRISPR-associated protein Csb1
MAEIETHIENLLKSDGPVAIIIKQPLAPVDDDERIIFPPTYPVTQWYGRIHTIRDGDYRVTVELPTGSKSNKDEKKGNQKPGYQIDRFPDGTNICVIDSPQSQSNRVEPKFKTIENGELVPQIEIKIGKEKKNLLDLGHRAGDAAVRMSSLAAEIHDAFTAAKSHDCFKLAMLAPTSLVFGVWDSRSTNVKQQRVFKAHILATNVREISRSAQYTPAVDYVDAGAIGEDSENKTGDETNLSQEGMVHALSTQAVGGVMLTDSSRLVRTVNVNLEAIRALQGAVPQKSSEGGGNIAGGVNDATTAIQKYILGLALVAAFEEPDLNLREGCHLKYADGQCSSFKLIYRSKPEEDCPFTKADVLKFAKEAKKEFFKLAGIDESKIDRRDIVFENNVAERFLSYSKDDRDKIRRLGPITKETLDRFDAQGKDPFKRVSEELKNVKKNLGKKPQKNKPPIKNLDAFETVRKLLESMSTDATLPSEAVNLARQLAEIARQHDDSHEALKKIENQIKVFNKSMKGGEAVPPDGDRKENAE